MNNFSKIKELAKKIRTHVLNMALIAKENSSHFGGSLSTVEIIACIFENFISQNDKLSQNSNRHRFVLSKGHGCLAYYAALCELGYFSKKDLETFEQDESFLLGHPVINRQKGIEFSTGSLGMGLGLSIGQAISLKLKKIDKKIFVIIGDGECNEGSVWEAAMFAPNYNLDNLTVILDHNKFQQTGSNNQIMNLGNIKDKWEAFNWNVIEVDGHNIHQICEALDKLFENKKPKMILANTIKGKGFSFSENNNEWHHRVLTSKNFEEAKKEI